MFIKKILQLFIILFLSVTTFLNYSFAQSDELKSLFQSTKSAYKSGELTKLFMPKIIRCFSLKLSSNKFLYNKISCR